MDIAPGTVVANRYRISHPLGRGGMGEVFAGQNIRTGRPVALKLLRAESQHKASAVARFRQEARAAGSINSDHVTQVLDVEDDPQFGIVLVFELLEGESLIDRLKRTGPLPFDELFPIIEQVWIGLSDAHKAGIIHRDLKPSNVFLERRPDGSTRVKILDFGISKLPKEMGGETLTEIGQSLGTFSFMPPEQIGKAKTVDHRADIYACATLIFQSLSAQLPYAARTIMSMVEMKAKMDARRLSEVMPSPVEPQLEAFVAKGLSRDPNGRFQTAAEALAAWRDLRPSSRSAALAPNSSQGPMSPPQHAAHDPHPIADPETDSVATLAMPIAQLAFDPRRSASSMAATRPMPESVGPGGTQMVHAVRMPPGLGAEQGRARRDEQAMDDPRSSHPAPHSMGSYGPSSPYPPSGQPSAPPYNGGAPVPIHPGAPIMMHPGMPRPYEEPPPASTSDRTHIYRPREGDPQRPLPLPAESEVVYPEQPNDRWKLYVILGVVCLLFGFGGVAALMILY